MEKRGFGRLRGKVGALDLVQLLIHEFVHEFSSDHLSSEYHEALCRIGAKLFAVAKMGEL